MTHLKKEEGDRLIDSISKEDMRILLVDASCVYTEETEKLALYPKTEAVPDLAVIGWKLEDGQLIVAFNMSVKKTRTEQFEDAVKEAKGRPVKCLTFGWIDRGELQNLFALTQMALQGATRLH